jgi:hypothetical protein
LSKESTNWQGTEINMWLKLSANRLQNTSTGLR